MTSQISSEILSNLKNLIESYKPVSWMTLREVCKYTRLSEPTLRRYVKRGALKASQSTGKLLFKRDDVDRWLQNGKT